ncbi:FAD-dependent oxidoreductase [Arcanobacterium hippocoleae]|uniref:ferredoxin--NADP(+) reductase n=1 Tax=Arcanobacterium hippocoleae TaxID=149017 RepID=A0ABU1T472_9ACTO|nr:FAD-dependent oxidoreductase [Arcanobacterium hippocoleae]MDR6940010.1 ferredoxin--NADP+ reductase [Arcanobacterium hippocoleae]
MTNRPLQVAVIGAGPAGIYASDILAKSDVDAQIDLYEKLPAPYGLVRYGVAPDHPRIKQIIKALYNILQRGDIRLVGNVEVGKDLSFDELHKHYDAIIIATGADRDRPLHIPGADLPEVYGASEFVYWYDGHPDVPRTWPLAAKEVAVIGVGNVALDVARVLAKHPDDLLTTEIPQNVEEGLRQSPITDVHVFGRRGPAQVKFTPMELRELGEVPDVDIIVYEEDYDYDEASQEAVEKSKMTRQVVNILTDYLLDQEEPKTASRRIHLHLLQQPVEILGDTHVTGIRMERTALQGDETVAGTGEFIDYPVQAVYRAVGYFSSPIPGAPFDGTRGVVPNQGGRVTRTVNGETITGLYATGWIKRGPVGLIGSTKSDAQETIANLVADYEAGLLHATSQDTGWVAMQQLLENRGVRYTTWHGWELLEEYEKSLGEAKGRERIKVVERETMTAISRNEPHDGKLY